MLALDHVWKVKFFQMRVSDRKLPFIEPGKAWIMPIGDTQYEFWPPPCRGSGRRRGGADDGGDGADGRAALQDDLDFEADDSDQSDGDAVAEHREIVHLLDEGLAAMRRTFEHASADNNATTKDDEQEPDQVHAPQMSDDDSDSDSSSNSGGSVAADDGMAPAAAEAAADDASIRGTADAAFLLPGGCGIIRCYSKTNNFTAECKCINHAKCIKTRQSTAAAALATSKKPSANVLAKGRPLGCLTAWLLDGSSHGSKAEHWALENELLATTNDKRSRARELLAAYPEGRLLLEHDRPRRAGEPAEPEGVA